MLELLRTRSYRFMDQQLHIVVTEFTDHPARKNKLLSFCADGWWRIECWMRHNNVPTLFATVIIVRVYDEKKQNQYVQKSERVCMLHIPIEGYFHNITLVEKERAVTIGYSPNEHAILKYLGLRLPQL